MSVSIPADRPIGLRRRLVQNVSAQTTSYAVSVVLGFATTYVLSRRLGPEGYGGFRFLFVFIYFFQTLNDLGINPTVIREIAQTPERTRELVHGTLGFKMMLAPTSMLAAWIAAALWPGLTPQVRIAVAIFALILPIQALTLPITVLQARVQIKRAVAVEVVNRFTGFAAMMIAIVLGHGLITVTIALVVGELAGLFTVIALTRGIVLPVPAFDTRVWKQVLRSSLPLGAVGLLVSLVNRFDSILLQLLLGKGGMQAVGYYGAAYQITGLFEKLPLFIMATLYPTMARLAEEDPRRLWSVYRRSIRTLSLVTVPLVVVVMIGAPLMIRLLNGPRFGPSVLPLRILVWATAFLYPAMVAGNLLVAVGATRKNLTAWVIAAPVNLGLDLVLIPKFGVPGAAFATAVSLFIVLVAVVVMAGSELRRLVRERDALFPAALAEGPG